MTAAYRIVWDRLGEGLLVKDRAELARVLEAVGLDPSRLVEAPNGSYRLRAVVDGARVIVEGDPDWDPAAWVANPGWVTVAEEAWP